MSTFAAISLIVFVCIGFLTRVGVFCIELADGKDDSGCLSFVGIVFNCLTVYPAAIYCAIYVLNHGEGG